MSINEILKPFEHTQSQDSAYLFGEDIVVAANLIRNLYKSCNYDHRPFLPKAASKEEYPWVWTEEFRRGQACFKYAVAAILHPKSVFEIGVGAGISALAFGEATELGLRYFGLDLDTKESFFDLRTTVEMLSKHLVTPTFLKGDSKSFPKLPSIFDLVHIDGGHDFETAKNDMLLAWRSESKWILVDDANDSAVAAGVFSAVHDLPHGKTDYAYFEDTWSGNLLFRRTG